MKIANYRKINDRSMNSSTYHKKDGTNVRARLERDSRYCDECGMPWYNCLCRHEDL